MGQFFLPNLSVSATGMYLLSSVSDREAFEVYNPVSFDVIKLNPFLHGEYTGRWPTRDNLFGGAGFADFMMGLGWLDIDPYEPTGHSTWRYRITGICQNAIGNPVAGALCTLYRTADKFPFSVMLSDSDGRYAFGVPDNTTAHYVVAMQEAPAIAGASVNTLVGS